MSPGLSKDKLQPLTMQTANEHSQKADDDDELMQAEKGVAEPETPELIELPKKIMANPFT